MAADSENLRTMVGFDDCIIGVCSRFGSGPFVVYDREKVLKKLEDDGMSHEEAEDFHAFNQSGAWFGEDTPGFIDPLAG